MWSDFLRDLKRNPGTFTAHYQLLSFVFPPAICMRSIAGVMDFSARTTRTLAPLMRCCGLSHCVNKICAIKFSASCPPHYANDYAGVVAHIAHGPNANNFGDPMPDNSQAHSHTHTNENVIIINIRTHIIQKCAATIRPSRRYAGIFYFFTNDVHEIYGDHE